MQYTTLLVDSSYLAYQMYFSTAFALSDSPGTQLAHGFLVGLVELSKVYQIETLVVVWDSGHGAKDRVYARYKETRSGVLDDEQREDFRIQFELLNEFLAALGVKCCFAIDAEADDVIAHLCIGGAAEVLNGQGGQARSITVEKPILILSGDHDLYPLISDDVSMWKSRKRELYTIDNFRQEYSLEPWQYKEMLALMGCTGDNVPGAKGIGPKYAERLIKTYKSLEGVKNADGDDPVVARVQSQWEMVELSCRLVAFETVRPVVTVYKPDLSKARKQLFASGINDLITDWSDVVHLSEL